MRSVWPGSSETYLANVIRRLVRGGLLVSQRGISGGYTFARSPEEITLHDIVALLEGVSYARCALTPTGKCPVQDDCVNYAALCDLQQKYTDLLAGVTIAALARDMKAPMPGNGEILKAIPVE
jgi:Rrf2 family protein